MAEVKAQLNNLRQAPRKVRAVIGLLKGKNVNEALNQLEYYVRRPVEPVKKLINSAIANGENNFNMIKENLYIKSILVNEGKKLKRFRAKGFGRAAQIQKKTSQIVLILDERTAGLRREKTAKVKKEKETAEDLARETKIHDKKPAEGEARPPRRDDESRPGRGRPEIKQEMGNKGNVLGNLGKRLFQRKAI